MPIAHPPLPQSWQSKLSLEIVKCHQERQNHPLLRTMALFYPPLPIPWTPMEWQAIIYPNIWLWQGLGTRGTLSPPWCLLTRCLKSISCLSLPLPPSPLLTFQVAMLRNLIRERAFEIILRNKTGSRFKWLHGNIIWNTFKFIEKKKVVMFSIGLLRYN